MLKNHVESTRRGALRALKSCSQRAVFAAACAAAILAGGAQAQTVPLGAAQSFAVLGGSQVTNTGATVIIGDLGVSPGTEIGGFAPGTVTEGSIHANDAVAVQAHADAAAAYATLAGLPVTLDLSGQNLGSRTLPPGVYSFSSSAQLTGQLILDGDNQDNPLFVFQISSTLTTATASSIVLINGADVSNVYFQVGSSATLGTGTMFTGTIISSASNTLTTDATVSGRVIALDGAVTLDSNDITLPPPTASITSAFTGSANGADYLRITVRYTDDLSMDLNSIDQNDVELRRAGGATIAATLVSRVLTSANVVTAVYNFAAPGSAWDSSDNGVYSVWLRPFQVSDEDGHFAASQFLNAYTLWFNSPTAAVIAEIADDGGTYFDAGVLYTDTAGSPIAISWGSIGNGDVELAGPNGYLQQGVLRNRSIPQAGRLLATYRTTAANGYWDWTDNGSYTLRVRANQVWDAQGYLVAPRTLRTYGLFFQTPNAVVTNTTVVEGGTSMLVAIVYRANNRLMSWNSLGSGDVELAGPSGFLQSATLVSRTYSGGSNSYTVVYSIPARNGTWDSSDNGAYSLRVRANEVFDSLGYRIPAVELQAYGLHF